MARILGCPRRVAGIAAGVLLLAPGTAHSQTESFPSGSLIIPMQLSYQSASGIPSAYGLVWRILEKNSNPSWEPVTVYVVNNPSKASPNRCTPTDKDTPPSYANDERWVDGCDFSVTNLAGAPVKKVDWAASTVTGGIATAANFSTVDTLALGGNTTATYSFSALVNGQWACAAGSTSATFDACVLPPVTTVRTAFLTGTGACLAGYAPTAISACWTTFNKKCPAGTTLTVLNGTKVCAVQSATACPAPANFSTTFPACSQTSTDCPTATLTAGNGGALVCAEPLNTAGECSQGTRQSIPGCMTAGRVGTTIFPGYRSQTVGGGTNPVTTVRFMGQPFVIHAADVPAFLKRMKDDPDLAKFRQPGACRANAVSITCHEVDIYQATADFTAPVGNIVNKTPPKIALLEQGTGVASGILTDYLNNAGLNFVGAAGCPPGSTNNCGLGAPGKIFDIFHANKDLISTAAFPDGLLNRKDPDDPTGKRYLYSIFWTPHWVGTDTRLAYFNNGDGARTELENVINNITKFANRATGMFAECASIETYEGSCTTGTCPPDAFKVLQPPGSGGRFHSTAALYTNGLSDQGWVGRNCTDPDITPVAGGTPSAPCVKFDHPADPFVQIADMLYVGTGGHVHNYRPLAANGSEYPAYVNRLARSYSPTSPSDVDWDFFTSANKDGSPRKGLILYLAGHSYGTSLAGNRIALNTLLNLGFTRMTVETARTGPVALTDPASGSPALLQASYDVVTTIGFAGNYKTFAPASASRWIFPYNAGYLRLHKLADLKTGQNAYGDAVLWNAKDAMPAPGARNVFTYLGGVASVCPTLATGGQAPNGVLQVGWKPVKFAAEALVPGDPACVDEYTVGKQTRHGKTAAEDTFRFGLIPKAGGDGICDLQQVLQYSRISAGSDWGASERTANEAQWSADREATQQMVQMVRGFCAANGDADGAPGTDGIGAVVTSPAVGDCNNGSESDNTAFLGGFVNSVPVIMGPSKYVPVKSSSATRPTVAFLGGLDGQLHAFYVGGGAGYTGPAGSDTDGALPSINSVASTAFSSTLPLDVSTWAPGTELWSFIPPSQLPFLKTNDASVDGSPMVVDVFADFQGKGVREWRSVLVASSGAAANDLFALDVTNPLRPALLWVLQASDRQKPLVQASAFTPVVPADDELGYVSDAGWKQALLWKNTGFDKVSGANVRAEYHLPPASDPGRDTTGLYNFAKLGGTRSVQVGVVLAEGRPQFSAFVASNYGPNDDRGLEVFAIDLVTGQKRWQFEQAYVLPAADRESSNAVPSGTALVDIDRDGFIDTLYVGDMEGRMWEVDAANGTNRIVVSNTSYPLVDTAGSAAAPQPITTQPAVFLIPPDTATSGPLLKFRGELAIAFGTGGAGFVADNVPIVTGQIHLALLSAARRWDLQRTTNTTSVNGDELTPSEVRARVEARGMSQEPAPFPVTKDSSPAVPVGHRFYGAMTTVNGRLYFSTAAGKVGFADGSARANGGQTLSVDLFGTEAGKLPTTPLSADAASTGQVTVVHVASTNTTATITTTTKGISVARSTGDAGRKAPDQKILNPTVPVRLIGWLRRLAQ